MPQWLLKFLIGLITPIVESVIEKLLINIRLSALEKDREAFKEGFQKLSEAKTPKEVQDAAHSIATRWNNN